MSQWIYTLAHLLLESFSAHRDAQIRFLKEENRILRSRISSQRLILDPEERTRLLTIGAELKHQVKGLVGIVQFRTYQRWVKEQELGIKPGRVGRPRKIGKDVRNTISGLSKRARAKAIFGSWPDYSTQVSSDELSYTKPIPDHIIS
ncbi:MAG: hypothetical protein KTR15_10970 [Phycisphaeraceae bacterium]|nr:hypothetical protein [Phycisphaeraceae bacterium]